MGVVYEAEQESLGRRVALKVLSASSLLDPKQVRRFEREAKAAARLHHTNIVPVFGVGRQDGHHYFVMQFIAGLGLDMVLDELRRLRGGKSEAKPAPAVSQVAGLTGADVARSLITGRFDAVRPPADGSVTEPCDDVTPGRRQRLSGRLRLFPGDPAWLVRAVGVVRPRPPVLSQHRPHRRPGGRGPGICQSPGHPPSRHQAVEPACWTITATSGWPTSAWPRQPRPTT